MGFDVWPLVTPATTALLTNEVQPATVGGGAGLGAAGAGCCPTSSAWPARPGPQACRSFTASRCSAATRWPATAT